MPHGVFNEGFTRFREGPGVAPGGPGMQDILDYITQMMNPLPGTKGALDNTITINTGGSRIPRSTTRRSLRGQLRTSGFALPYNVNDLIDKTVRAEGGMSFLLDLILDDERFTKTFPGIFNADGTLRMTPVEYRQNVKEFTDIAARNGFRLNPEQVGMLIESDTSPREFAELRAPVIATIKRNEAALVNFNDQIRLRNKAREKAGLEPIKELRTLGDVKDFVTGRADRPLYLLAEGAFIATAAEAQGVDISDRRARGLARRTTEIVDIQQAEERFARIAALAREIGPELRASGIRQRDLLRLEFGNPGDPERGRVATELETTIRQRQATLQHRPPVTGAVDERGRPRVETGREF